VADLPAQDGDPGAVLGGPQPANAPGKWRDVQTGEWMTQKSTINSCASASETAVAGWKP
jgi:hypothetical protein